MCSREQTADPKGVWYGKNTREFASRFCGKISGEPQISRFAKKADQEGFPQVAKLFRAAAAAETVHAHNHLRVMGGINDTTENLKTAIAGENYESVSMYPEFIALAEADGG